MIELRMWVWLIVGMAVLFIVALEYGASKGRSKERQAAITVDGLRRRDAQMWFVLQAKIKDQLHPFTRGAWESEWASAAIITLLRKEGWTRE